MKDVRSEGKGVGTCGDRGKKLQVGLYGVTMWLDTVGDRHKECVLGLGRVC